MSCKLGIFFFFFPSRPSGARNLHSNTNKTSLKINWCFWPSRNSWDFQIWPMGTSAQAFSGSISEPELSPKNKILQSSMTKEPSRDSRYRTSAQIKQSIKRAIPQKTAVCGAQCTGSGQAEMTRGCLPSHVGYCVPFSTNTPASHGFFLVLAFLSKFGEQDPFLEGIQVSSKSIYFGLGHYINQWLFCRDMTEQKIRRKICQTARNELEIVAVSPGSGRDSCLKDSGPRVCLQLHIMMSPGAKREGRLFKTSHDFSSSISFNCFKGHHHCLFMDQNPRRSFLEPGTRAEHLLSTQRPRYVCKQIGQTAACL